MMKSVSKQPADSAVCPTCKQQVTVPKSTRSFICRSCDAVIKVVLADDGVELKVVGRSVEDDETFQALEARIAALKEEIDDLHTQYVVEMERNYGSAGSRIRNVGFLALLMGIVWSLRAPAIGAAIAGAGLIATIVGIAVNSSRKRTKQVVAGPIADALHRVGAERDLLQRKATRLKTIV
jgi:hypothetical protein